MFEFPGAETNLFELEKNDDFACITCNYSNLNELKEANFTKYELIKYDVEYGFGYITYQRGSDYVSIDINAYFAISGFSKIDLNELIELFE